MLIKSSVLPLHKSGNTPGSPVWITQCKHASVQSVVTASRPQGTVFSSDSSVGHTAISCRPDVTNAECSLLVPAKSIRPTYGVTTCRENLELSGNLSAVRETSGILLKVREMWGKNCIKLFIVSCIFASILDFAELVYFILVSDHALLYSYPHHWQ